MLSFADMMYLLADELAGLCGCRFALALVLLGSFESLFFRHFDLLSNQ